MTDNFYCLYYILLSLHIDEADVHFLYIRFKSFNILAFFLSFHHGGIH